MTLCAEIQEYIYDIPNKPKGSMYVNNGTYFKIKNDRVYYYHRGMKKWERSCMFITKEVQEFYKCNR